MALRRKKACQALSQRVKGENIFKNGFIDHLDTPKDPNWVHKEVSKSDSEFKDSDGWAIRLSKKNPIELSDSEAGD